MSIRDTKLQERYYQLGKIRLEGGPYAKLLDFFALAKRSDIYSSCITCLGFDNKQELCKKANPPSRPPADIIANGCDAYEDEAEIPF
jgi:hypothetical protein